MSFGVAIDRLLKHLPGKADCRQAAAPQAQIEQRSQKGSDPRLSEALQMLPFRFSSLAQLLPGDVLQHSDAH